MRRLLHAILALAALGCAGNKAASSRVVPPELITRSRPDLQVPPGPPRPGLVLDVALEVMVDAAGKADVSTMKLTGVGAADNRPAVTVWLQQVRFRPGRQGGLPVAALYRDRWRAEARAVIRRS